MIRTITLPVLSKIPWNIFLPKTIICGPKPQHFFSLCTKRLSTRTPNMKCSHLPLFPLNFQAFEKVQKLAVASPASCELSLNRLRFFSKVCRRINSDLTCMFRFAHSFFRFRMKRRLCCPIHSGHRGHTCKFHQQWCDFRGCQNAFSV